MKYQLTRVGVYQIIAEIDGAEPGPIIGEPCVVAAGQSGGRIIARRIIAGKINNINTRAILLPRSAAAS